MAEQGRDGSPGRQRRSTERSRENIREYVKLLSRKVTGSPSGQRTPRLQREVKTPEGVSDCKPKQRGDSPPSTSTKVSAKKQETPKELSPKKGSAQAKKSPKAMGKSGLSHTSPSGGPSEAEVGLSGKELAKSASVIKVGAVKGKVSMPVLKNVRMQEIVIEASTSRSITKSGSTDSLVDIESDIDNLSYTEDFEREEGEAYSKVTGESKVTPPDASLKRQKSGRVVDCKSDSPPDLVLFLKEGRGRAQNYSEPPTLESETIATRRRTRVPSDPKSIDISKKMCASQPKAKKDLKGIQKKENKREKLKVLDTPVSLKRLAQGIPLKDQSKSSVTVKHETPKTTTEGRPKKRNMLKNLTEKTIKQERSSTPVSDEEGNEIEEGRQQRGRRRGHSSESTSSQDDSQSSPSPNENEDDAKSNVGYLNINSVLQRVPDNMADEKIPIVIMSNSDQDKPTKAMPKSRKNPLPSEEVRRRAFIKLASSSSENSPVNENKSFIDLEGKVSADVTTEDKEISIQKVIEVRSTTLKKKLSKKYQQSENMKRSNVDSSSDSSKSEKLSLKADSETGPNRSKVETVVSPEASVSGECKIILPVSRTSGDGKSSEPIKICSSLTMKKESEHGVKGSPLVVRVSDLISLSMANRTLKPSLAGGKLNIRMSNVDVGSSSGITKNTFANRGLETFLIKGDTAGFLPKTIFKVGDTNTQDNTIPSAASQSQKFPVIDYTDIETQEVVVGEELEDPCTQSLVVGHLPEEMDLRANEELGSSSDEDRAKSPEPQCSTKKEALSPEGKVALDHSYSSGSSDGGKVAIIPKKKPAVPCEKPLTSRPVYSSASLAKRSLDIMLHNDKINILRQMSQIFNDEKPVQPENQQPVSSSEGEGDGEDETKVIKERPAEKTKEKGTNELKKEDNFSKEGEKKDEQTSKLSSQKFLPKNKSTVCSSNLVSSQPSKKSQVAMTTDTEGSPSKSHGDEIKVICKKTESTQSTCGQNQKDASSVKEEEAGSPFKSCEDPKVHHVSMYSLVPDEQISVQSSVGTDGEHLDIVDGFTFVSFNSLEEMNTYTEKQGGKIGKRHCPWLKRKRRKKFIRYKKKQPYVIKNLGAKKGESRDDDESMHENQNLYNSSAFASNDLDTYLTNNSHLNISYTIPKCKATEDGVTRLGDDELLEDTKPPDPQTSYPDHLLQVKSQPSDNVSDGGSAHTVESEPFQQEQIHHYEEVNAIDILYPKEKYKYYYNKDLCKDTKADGSNVFVRRAGKLVPLTSVFKSQKTNSTTASKKTAELVYVYDGGKLLTLGGSLTKINPSNSDSVRARVILPIGIPPIMKGDISQSKAKKVQAVEINEDMAKFALSALQNPESKDKLSEEKVDSRGELQKIAPEESKGTEERKEEKKHIVSEIAKKPSEIIKAVPTKRNILDIIAAKLAMADGESDKEDCEENTSPKDEDHPTGKSKGSEENENMVKEEEVGATGEEEKVANVVSGKEETNQETTEGEFQGEIECADEKNGDHSKTDSKLETQAVMEMQEIVETKTSDGDEKKSVTEFELENVGEQEKLECKIETADNTIGGDVKGESGKKSPTTCSDKVFKDVQDTKVDKDSGRTQEESANALDGKLDPENALGSKSEAKQLAKMTKNELDSQNLEKTMVEEKAEKPESIIEESDSKSRTFKKNMYRFPSLSREMKRLNMNFVNYTMEEPMPDEGSGAENEPKDACTHEHCLLGCLCDTLSCRRRDPEHCGRVECMFECQCRDESWKHAVSGVGRTMNAVSIFNLDREQKEGLALREKDFKKTVIQTGSEVILVGAERKKRERRIPGRYRDSAVWMGGDLVDMDCATHSSEPEVPPEPEYPSIPISEAHKYIKKCKIQVPWYDVKGISVWCMDHSCYDCKCLKEPDFYSGDLEEQLTTSRRAARASTSIDSIEEALKQETNSGLAILSPHNELDGIIWDGRCVVVNIHVNNTEAKRKYSWKLKEWYHPRGMHSARTVGYSKKNVVEETKHLTLTGLSSQESTPEQIVENVVRSLKDPRTKLFVPALGDFPRSSGVRPLGTETPEPKEAVPLVDLTASAVNGENATGASVPEQNAVSPSEVQHVFEKDVPTIGTPRIARKRSAGSLDIFNSPDLEGPSKPKKASTPDSRDAEGSVHKDERGLEAKKSTTNQAQRSDRFPYRKPVSLLEMMIAEEKRGELELDLSNNFPGNAMLVAESRFRKLINMNIIGVIGINKSGRCIIATVDSIESMRVMQRIHSMINNNSLDVGPNMREIFFPPPHSVSRPRFVMIRCDGSAKWEIVGVVQKKGPFANSKSGESKSKQVPKPRPSIPQVVDLEEEERQKEKLKGKPDIVILADSETNEEDGGEKEGGDWEGSLPLIASVHSASDGSMADFMDLKDAAFNTGEHEVPEEVLSPRPQREESLQGLLDAPRELEEDETTGPMKKAAPLPLNDTSVPETTNLPKKVKALPDLVPISLPTSTETTEGLSAALSENTNINISNNKHAMALKNIQTNAVGPVTLTKMKTIKLNQTSSRIFGDSPVLPSGSFVQSPRSTSQIIVTTTTPSSALHQKVTISSVESISTSSDDSPAIVTSAPRIQSPKCSPQVVATSLSSSPHPPKVSSCSVEKNQGSHSGASIGKADLSVFPKQIESTSLLAKDEVKVPTVSFRKVAPSPPASSMFRPRIQSTQSKGTSPTLVPRIMPSGAVSPRMLYIPVSSNSLSKMVLMPSVSSGSPRMMFMSTSSKMPTTNTTQDSGKMKMVLVPSANERSKMVLQPSCSMDTSASAPTSESESKLTMLPQTQTLNLVGPQESLSSSIPKNIPEVNLVDNAESSECRDTSLTSAKTKVREADSDDSDDVVVIGTSSNTLTITRVKSLAESGVSESAGVSTAPSIVIMPSTKPVVSSSGNAQTTVVSSVSTISSTLPQISQSQSKECDIIDSSGDKLNSAEDMVIVKTSLNESQLNALLQNTHKDMLKNAEQALDQTRREESGNNMPNVSENKEDATELHPITKDTSPSTKSSLQSCKNKSADVQEVESKPVPIKKIGNHWSAVDLSLSFKSVKLEWLHGTIRKNVLVNIFRMSQKTLSPVTLSVKNGSSTSMLYGLARRGYSEKKQPLPILILGSIISAVLSSSSTTDDMLFHGNAVKYFIRESTGELSSYTYDLTGEYLVKLASKKRGNGGEMIGIGEKVLLQKMRDSSHSGENLLLQSPDKRINPKKMQEDSKDKRNTPQEDVGCSCTAAGDFICHGHSTPDSTPLTKNEAIPMPQITEVKSLKSDSKDAVLFQFESPLEKSSVDSKDQTLDTVMITPATKEICGFKSNIVESKKAESESQLSNTNKSLKQPSISDDTPSEDSLSKEVQVLAEKVVTPGTSSKRKVSDVNMEIESTEDAIQHENPSPIDANESEDVDIEEVEQGSSMLLKLREQVAEEAGKVNKGRGFMASPGEVAKRLFSTSETIRQSGVKRKADMFDHHYERPCPRSKKKLLQNQIFSSSPKSEVCFTSSPLQSPPMQQRAASIEAAEYEPRPGPSGVKRSFKPKTVPSALQQRTKKDLLRIQRKFSDIESAGEERNSVVHNELERIRRRLMKKLFSNLQQATSDLTPMPKVAILSIATKVCKELLDEEARLTSLEEEVRAERSILIKRLASFIADQGDEVKKYWKQWVRTNMKYPVSKIVFEKNWKPAELDKDVLNISSNESSLDMDLDDGSPLSAPSSPHSTGDSFYAALTSKTVQSVQVRKIKLVKPRRKPLGRFKKNVNASQKLILDGRLQGLNVNAEAAGSIPTSILLMAGTSSRGRKIVRKEDINFVPS